MRSTLVTLALFLPLATLACAPEYDLVIRNGDLVDGTGSPARRADVAIKGDRIVAVGTASGERAPDHRRQRPRRARPGFIDVQGQSGTSLLDGRQRREPHPPGHHNGNHRRRRDASVCGRRTHTPRVFQRGAWLRLDGIRRLPSHGGKVEAHRSTWDRLRRLPLIREQVLGDGRIARRRRTSSQREEGILERAMQQGAFGFATALIYPPASYTNHRRAHRARPHRIQIWRRLHLARPRRELPREGGDRRSDRNRTGRRSLPVVIYHLKIGAKANWGRMDDIRARDRGRAGALA